MNCNGKQRYYDSCDYDSSMLYKNSKDVEYKSNVEKIALRRIELNKTSYYDMYDVYDVDCDDGTVGDKIFIPKNKMMNIKNK